MNVAVVSEAVRAASDFRENWHQLALAVNREARRGNHLDEDPRGLRLDRPLFTVCDLEHRRMTDVFDGHLVDVHAVIGYFLRRSEDAQGSLDQLLLCIFGESLWSHDSDDWHGSYPLFGFVVRHHIPPLC